MEDSRVWEFEKSLWTGDADHYRASIDDECLMVLPAEPSVLDGEAAIAAVSGTPRWTDVQMTETRIARPEEGLIVVAYKVEARRDANAAYVAHCTSTYRRLAHDDWRVVQHQQTPPLAIGSQN